MAIPLLYTDSEPPRLHFIEPPGSAKKCCLTYLNEGGANFVFGIVADENLQSPLHRRLLRLRKDLPHVQSARDQLAAFDEHFKPLFPAENLVQHDLIGLDARVSNRINEEFEHIHRPVHRRDDFLPTNETYGLLVTDMTPQEGDILLQLKPKWLVQSPSAPKDAKRCRTCALRAMRATKHVRTATDSQGNCPLSLISQDETEREQAVSHLTNDEQLRMYLLHEAQPLLQKLRFWQSELDLEGVLNLDAEDSILDFRKAMTLRDCTLFLKRSGGHVEARFADLDLKQPNKLHAWKKVERQLLDDGWYTNSENEAEWVEERVCHLSRPGQPS